jgi:hypothetical protein
VHAVTGGPQVFWHTDAGSPPSRPPAASGSDNGRDSLASKSHVQFVAGICGLHPSAPSPPAERRSRAPKRSTQRRVVTERVLEAPARTPGAYLPALLPLSASGDGSYLPSTPGAHRPGTTKGHVGQRRRTITSSLRRPALGDTLDLSRLCRWDIVPPEEVINPRALKNFVLRGPKLRAPRIGAANDRFALPCSSIASGREGIHVCVR